MEQLLKKISEYREEIETFSAADEKQLEEFRIKYLGTKGIVKAIMGEMKNVPADKKKEFGQVLNDFKVFTENKFESLKEASIIRHPVSSIQRDLTLPGDSLPPGSR